MENRRRKRKRLKENAGKQVITKWFTKSLSRSYGFQGVKNKLDIMSLPLLSLLNKIRSIGHFRRRPVVFTETVSIRQMLYNETRTERVPRVVRVLF